MKKNLITLTEVSSELKQIQFRGHFTLAINDGFYLLLFNFT